MAQASDLLDQDQLSCSICLDLLKDPVAIPCGHSYCMVCIKGCWDRDDHTSEYRCPQCREIFIPRPVLRKNTMLAEVVEKLRKIGLQAAPPAHCYAGPDDVACDVCTGRKRKAVKSCLMCLASYCETHMKHHEELNPGKRHKLIDASGNLQEKICSRHDKLLEVYCCTDQQCICYLCLMDGHRSHDTVSAAAERAEKQKQLGVAQSKFQKRIQEREKEVQDLRLTVQSLKHSAQAAVEDSERLFIELIRFIERRRSELTKLIRDQEKAELSRAEGLLERLEQEIAELRRRDTQLEQLSHTEDHIHFLQSCQTLCAPLGPDDLPSIPAGPHVSFEALNRSVSELKGRLADIFSVELDNIIESVRKPGSVSTFGPLRLTASHPSCSYQVSYKGFRGSAENNECPICMDNFPKDEMQRLPCCQCSLCCDCFKQHFTIAVRDKHIRDMVCPVCCEPDINNFDSKRLQVYFSLLGAQLRKCLELEIYYLFCKKLTKYPAEKDPNLR